jgi:hypothetical protein
VLKNFVNEILKMQARRPEVAGALSFFGDRARALKIHG